MARFIQLTQKTKEVEEAFLINSNLISTIRREGDLTRIGYNGNSIFVVETPGEITALSNCKKKDMPDMMGSIKRRRTR